MDPNLRASSFKTSSQGTGRLPMLTLCRVCLTLELCLVLVSLVAAILEYHIGRGMLGSHLTGICLGLATWLVPLLCAFGALTTRRPILLAFLIVFKVAFINLAY